MSTSQITRLRLAAAGGAVLAALAGCTTSIPGIAVPVTTAASPAPGPTAGQEIVPGVAVTGQQGAVAAAYRQHRALDPCALHDPAAAAAVTGAEVDQLMPGASLADCELTVEPGGGSLDLPTWRISATVGVSWDDVRAQDATAEQLGGVEVFLVPESHDPGERACTMVRPHGQGVGLELRVQRQTSDAQPQKPCEIARAYLAEVARYWATPALRSDGLSSPALPVAEIDPCAGLGAVAARLGPQVQVSMGEPHACALMTSAPDGGVGDRVRVALAVETDPRPLLGSSLAAEYSETTVAGRAAVTHQPPDTGLGPTCLLTVIADDEVLIQADRTQTEAPASMQVVTAHAPDCALAVAAAEGVLALLP